MGSSAQLAAGLVLGLCGILCSLHLGCNVSAERSAVVEFQSSTVEQISGTPDWAELQLEGSAYAKQLVAMAEAKPHLADDCHSLAAGLRRMNAYCGLVLAGEPAPLPLVDRITGTCFGILKPFKAETWYRDVGTFLRQVLYGYQTLYGVAE